MSLRNHQSSPLNKNNMERVFKTPMTFSPRADGQLVRPSPSKREMLMEELGLDGELMAAAKNGISDGDDISSGDEEPEVDQYTTQGQCSAVEFHAMKKELDERNKQREDLMFRIKALSDKNKQYKAHLVKEETNKKQQIKIMRKTHETHLEEKREMVRNLQDIIDEQESKIFELESELKEGLPPNPDMLKPSSGLQKLVESLERLHREKSSLTEKLLQAQNSLEVGRHQSAETIAALRQQVDGLRQQEDSAKPKGVTDHEKQIQKLESERKVLQKQLEDSKAKITRLQTAAVADKSKMTSDPAELKRLREERGKLQERVLCLETDLAIKSKRLSDLEKEHQEQEKKVGAELRLVKQKLRNAEDELAQLISNPKVVEVTKTVSVESEATQEALAKVKLENNKLRAQLTALDQLKNSTQSQLEAANTSVQQLQRQLLENEKQADVVRLEFERELEKIDGFRVAAVEQARKDADHDVHRLQDRMDRLKESFSQVRPSLLGIAREYKSLRQLCAKFPAMIKSAVQQTKSQICQQISDINETNKELVRKYRKEMQLRKKYHNELVELKGNIRVFCRVRPRIKEDGGGSNSKQVVTYDPEDEDLVFVSNKGRTQTFDMDKVFKPDSTQEQVFNEVHNLILSCLDGFNVCIFAYGQTGSGKTYTMEGLPENPGLNQRALQLLFTEIQDRTKEWEYTVTVSVMEIYNEMLRDLLSDDPQNRMEIKMNQEGGLYVPGLVECTVEGVEQVNQLLERGKVNRATACTNMNEHSSRSHALLCVSVVGSNKTTGNRTRGKLNLVDLAGSERVSKSGADGSRLKEAQSINKSLSALGDVIHALRNKQAHTPYRNSKLTYLLQDSLGGDSKTLMMVQIAPVEKNVGETLSSISFAQRVRAVELGAATKKTESAEVADLKDKLSQYQEGSAPSGTPKNSTATALPGSKTTLRTPVAVSGRNTKK